VRHGHILKKCNTDECNNRAQREGICKTHGGGHICLVDGCSLAIFKGLKCNYHYNRPDVQCELVIIDQPSIMSFDNNIVQNILQFSGGWDNWEWVITFACVCKLHDLEDYSKKSAFTDWVGGNARWLSS